MHRHLPHHAARVDPRLGDAEFPAAANPGPEKEEEAEDEQGAEKQGDELFEEVLGSHFRVPPGTVSATSYSWEGDSILTGRDYDA